MGDQEALRDSFARIKHDFLERDSKINKLSEELDSLKKQLIDYIPKLIEQNNQILKRMEVLENSLVNKEDPLKNKILTSFKRGRKNVLKQKIMSLSSEKDMTINQLRDVIVGDLKYCSRASFYRYFEELRQHGAIDVVTVNKREIVKVLSQTISH